MALSVCSCDEVKFLNPGLSDWKSFGRAFLVNLRKKGLSRVLPGTLKADRLVSFVFDIILFQVSFEQP